MHFSQGVWAFATQPIPLLVLASAVALCWPIGVLLARRYRCGRLAAAGFVVSLGLIVALTLTPNPPPPGWPVVADPHFLTLLLRAPGLLRAQVFGPPTDLEQLANIALFVPLGFCGRFVWSSIVRSSLVGAAITVAVELCQYDIIGRSGSLTDIRNNTLGAMAGALIAAVAFSAPGTRKQ